MVIIAFEFKEPFVLMHSFNPYNLDYVRSCLVRTTGRL